MPYGWKPTATAHTAKTKTTRSRHSLCFSCPPASVQYVLASAAICLVPRASTTAGCPMSSARALARLEACRVVFV